MGHSSDALRLFYALWPDDEIRARLAALQAQISGRKTAPENLHMTLAFLGQQSRDRFSVLQQAMDDLPSAAITLTINTFGYFRKAQIAWAGPSDAPQSLFDLQQALWDRLLLQQVPLQASMGFKPHVTLARDAAAPEAIEAPSVIWPVRRIALMASLPKPGGVSYVALAERQLA